VHCQPELVDIRTTLNANPQGLSILEIAEIIGANRNSVAKYLEILQVQGSVDLRKIGNAKVYMPASRYPAETLKRLCTEGLLIVNHELSIVHCNNRLSDHLGSVPGTIIGTSLDDLVSPLRAGDQIMMLATAAVRGKEGAVSIVPMKQSLWHELRLNLLPVVFSNSWPGAAVIVMGLHENNRDGELKAGGPGFERMLLDQMVEVYCRLSPDQTVIDVNETFCRLSGHCREDLIGFRFKLMVPDEDWTRISGEMLALTPQSPLMTIEHRILTVEGLVRWARWMYRAIYSDGGLIEYLCTGLDITDQKSTEERLEYYHTHFEEIIRERTDEIREINRHLYLEVSHREAAEQQLRLTQFGFDNAAEMILWTDQYGIIMLINRQSKEVLGYTIGEPLMTFIGRNDPGIPENWQELWKLLVRNGSVKIERMIKRGDGNCLPVEMIINHLSFGGKEYVCFFIRDISERKKYETALMQAEEKYRLLTENARDVIFRISVRPEVSIDYISPSIERLTGYTPEQFYARPTLIDQVMNEHDHPVLLSFINDPRLSENPVTVRIRRLDTSRAWLEISFVLIRDDQGCITAVEGIGRDISIRKKIEMALVWERDRARLYFDLAGSLMMVIGNDLCVQMINRRGCTLLGYAEEEIIGKNWIDHFIPASDRDAICRICEHLLLECKLGVQCYLNAILTRDGTERLIVWHTTVLMDQNGDPLGILITGEVVTEKQAHQGDDGFNVHDYTRDQIQ